MIANLGFIFDLYNHASLFIRVCISKHGCAGIGTNICINSVVLTRVFVFTKAALVYWQ